MQYFASTGIGLGVSASKACSDALPFPTSPLVPPTPRRRPISMIARIFAALAGCFLAATVACSSNVARAQDPGTLVAAGATVLGTLTVKRIFSDIQQTLDQAQKAFESSGNRLLGSGVEQSYA